MIPLSWSWKAPAMISAAEALLEYPSFERIGASVREIVAARSTSAFGVDNHVSFLQKLIDEKDGSLKIASAIVLQVDNQVVNTLVVEFLECCHELIIGSGSEVGGLDT